MTEKNRQALTRQDVLTAIEQTTTDISLLREELQVMREEIRIVRNIMDETSRAVFGNHIEGMLARIRRVENLVCGPDGEPGLTERMRNLQRSVDRLDRVLWTIFFALVGVLAANIISIVAKGG